jgi:hypothetical protein
MSFFYRFLSLVSFQLALGLLGELELGEKLELALGITATDAS